MKIDSLTPLRFVAAMMVVMFHFGADTKLAGVLHGFFLNGPQMVTFFFVLSGFVMVLAHYNKPNDSPRDFYIARVARIVPIYVVALAAMCLLTFGTTKRNDIFGVFLNLTFLQAWLPPYALSFNGPAWSLSVEMFFYLLFPFILEFIQKKSLSGRAILGIALAAWLATQIVVTTLLNSRYYVPGRFLHCLLCYSPPPHLCSFLLGVAGGVIFLEHPRSRSPWHGLVSYVFVLSAIWLVYWALTHEGILSLRLHLSLSGGVSLHSPVFLALILAIAGSRNALTRFLSFPLFVLLGEASYSLYILQIPAHMLFERFTTHALRLDAHGYFYTYFLLLVGVSIGSYLFIERPSRKLIRQSFSVRGRTGQNASLAWSILKGEEQRG